ncbi:MAG: autotransporter domain-containing protein [Desulfuromonadales bacterium]|nr:autotransporter domain-containing protein [Desulfuromonadales bacterium]
MLTYGDESSGIWAQSAGSRSSGMTSVVVRNGVSTSGNQAVGVLAASRSTGGNAGNVDVEFLGALMTSGADATGMQAVSAGRAGSSDVTVSLEGDVKTLGERSMGVDARSEAGSGRGGIVDVLVQGDIWTEGADAPALFAQSLGDQGGGLVKVTVNGSLTTLGDRSTGLFAQSDPEEHSGDDVEVTISEDIITTGAEALGLFAQSIGGNGAGGVQVESQGFVETSGHRSPGLFAQSDAGQGAAGAVSVNLPAHVYTFGDESDALYAGSLGSAESGAVTVNVGEIYTAGEASRGVVAESVSEGASGDVTVNLTGTVTTRGRESDAVAVRSSGRAGSAGSLTIVADDAILTSGERSSGISASMAGAGQVTVSTQGEISTTGNEADGIRVQNISVDGSGGRVNITAAGSVNATGQNSHAISVEGDRDGAGGRLQVVFDGDMALGGSGTGSAVRFAGGGENALVTQGTLLTVDGLAGTALRGDSGTEEVLNSGVIVGNIDLGSGANLVLNEAQGTLIAGQIYNLGTGRLTNAGQLSPGDVANLVTTELAGDFVQTGSGHFTLDLDFDGTRTDRLSADGAAQVAGQIDVNLLNPERLEPGYHLVTIVSGEQGLLAENPDLAVQPSAVVSYMLVTPDPQTLALALDITYAPLELTENQRAVGQVFNDVQMGQGSDTFLRALFDIPDAADLSLVYEPLVPDYYDHFTRTTLKMTQLHAQPVLQRMQNVRLSGKLPANSLQSWSVYGGRGLLLAFNGTDGTDKGLTRLLDKEDEGSYGLWLNVAGYQGEQDRDGDFDGYEFDGQSLTAGLDGLFMDHLLLGVSLGYTQTDLDVDNNLGSGDIDSLYASLYGSYLQGRMYIDGLLSYGDHSYDNARATEEDFRPRIVFSDHDGITWSAQVEAGYTLSMPGSWRFQPFAGLSYVHLKETGFNESGAERLGLNVRSRLTSSLVSDLGARMARIYNISSGMIVPEIYTSWNYDFDIDEREITAEFSGYPGYPFEIKGRDEEANGLIFGVGLNFVGHSGFSSTLCYREEVRSGYRIRGVMGEMKFEF